MKILTTSSMLFMKKVSRIDVKNKLFVMIFLSNSILSELITAYNPSFVYS